MPKTYELKPFSKLSIGDVFTNGQKELTVTDIKLVGRPNTYDAYFILSSDDFEDSSVGYTQTIPYDDLELPFNVVVKD